MPETINNCTIIYIVSILVAIFVLTLIEYLVFKKTCSQLGNVVFLANQKLQFSGKFKYFMRIFFFMAFYVYFAITKGYEYSLEMWALTALFAFIESKFMLEPMMFNQKIGLYENGAITMTGAVIYEKLKQFGFKKDKMNNFILVLQKRTDIGEGGSCIYIELNEKSKYTKFLNTKCTYNVIKQR